FINDLTRPVRTHLYGRRMYEVMSAWETFDVEENPDYIRDYARIWQAADKIVYSSSLKAVSTARTRIERGFDPAAVRTLKATAPPDLSISGAGLAAEALRAGVVDLCDFFVAPIIIGGGTSAFPRGVRLRLRLEEERRFANGMVYLRYRASGGPAGWDAPPGGAAPLASAADASRVPRWPAIHLP